MNTSLLSRPPTVTVDIASLLKAPDSNESSTSPPRHTRSASVPPPTATTAIEAVSARGSPVYAASHLGEPGPSVTGVVPGKRSMPPHASESPAKKQSKWSQEEDALIIDLRGSGMKWDDISKRLPGRSAISCRLHYQNYLERRSAWDEERKNKLARLYERFKPEMWAKIAEEMAIPWRAAEAMHWQLGEQDIARRAGTTPFALSASTSEGPSSGSTASPRHSHSHSQGSLARDVAPGRGYTHGRTGPSSRPLASRRESVPHHVPVYTEQPPENYEYPHHGMPLAPIQTQTQPPRPGMLPGVAELTTGVSPYSTPAYALPPPSTSPAPGTTAGPGLFMAGMGYPFLEPTGSKRRRSPDNNSLSPEMNRRRHLDPRPEHYDRPNISRHDRGP
ncbi:hypothetical protein GGS26DRAFT_38449 [Hypomontagnella submonticulosa]|nr:hypothetical protein GGS26DRAFT_38449 [Hypomontagnella submonticulosa]